MVLRPMVPGDRQRILTLMRDEELSLLGAPVSQLADVDDLLGAPGLDVVNRVRVQRDGDRVIAFVALHPAPHPGELRAQLLISGSSPRSAHALLRTLDRWAAQDQPSGTPVVTTLFQLPGSGARNALSKHGWQVVHSYTRLRASLEDRSPATIPDGLTIRSVESEADLRAVHRVLEDSVAGHWKHQRREFTDFLLDQQSRAGHDPTLWLLAERAAEVAAAIIARDPPDRAWIAWLGVRPAYRKRGVAAALLRAEFDLLRIRGHDTVGVDVDTHNLTGAVDVYQAAGMTIVGRADQWSRTLAAPHPPSTAGGRAEGHP